MKLAYRTCAFKDMDLADVLRRIADAGYEGAELCLEDRDIPVDVLTGNKIAEVKDALSATGLELSSVSLHAPIAKNVEAFERVKKGIAIARAFDCDIFVACSGPGRGEKDDRAALQGRVAELTEVCQECGVFLALEPEPGFVLGSSQDMLHLIEDIGSDHLRVNLDIGHAFITDDDVCESIRQLSSAIVHTHFEDIAPDKTHKHLIPGEGAIDFRAIIDALREIGYGGWLTVDLFNIDPAVAARPALDVLRGALRE
ncbi:MAG: sugar phosphate isomerase/epimerase [Planctomycetes bacterium]|nr:sugar phosphate isomerase/epimerase [Planctomycetota bacterium]